jgi:hypothetical protein
MPLILNKLNKKCITLVILWCTVSHSTDILWCTVNKTLSISCCLVLDRPLQQRNAVNLIIHKSCHLVIYVRTGFWSFNSPEILRRVDRSFEESYFLNLQVQAGLFDCSTLKMKALWTCKTSASVYQSTRRNIPEELKAFLDDNSVFVDVNINILKCYLTIPLIATIIQHQYLMYEYKKFMEWY